MTDPFAATRRSLDRLGSSVVPVRDAALEQKRRERIIGAVNQQAARLNERRRARKVRWAFLAAAAVFGAVLVGVVARYGASRGTESESTASTLEQRTEIVAVAGSGCRVRASGGDRPAATGGELRTGETLVTPGGGRVRLSMGGQVDVRVSPQSELLLPAAPPAELELELVRGTSTFSVQPLPAGQREATPHDVVELKTGTK